MIAGHYGVAFAAKKVESRIPLWQLFLAVQLLDILWAIFILLGVEKGRTETNGEFNLFFYLPYSHGLLTSLGWSVLIYALVRLMPAPRGVASHAGALVLGAAVWSHFWLDLIAHDADLPVLWSSPKIGLGLSSHPVAEFLLETALIGIGVWLYLSATQGQGFLGRMGAALFAVLLVCINAATIFGSQASEAQSVAAIGLISYLIFAAIAFWVDRLRRPIVAPGEQPASLLRPSSAKMEHD